MKNSRFVANLKHQIEENPLVALGVAVVLITATSKLLDANTARQNSNTYAQEIARRTLMQASK